MLNHFECPSCGAPFKINSGQPAGILKCQYCGKSFQVNPDQDAPVGDSAILLQADFNDPNLPGWEKVNADKQVIVPGEQPSLAATFQPSDRVHYILKTSGYFEDQDIRVKIRFLEGHQEYIRAGVCTRYEDAKGGYCVLVSAQQTYILGLYETPPGGEMAWRSIMNWRFHSSLKPGLNQDNELRVVHQGTQLSIYLNGVLATSITDSQYRRGQSHLAAEPSEKTSIKVAFTDLVILRA